MDKKTTALPTPPFDLEILTLPPELPPDMRSVWSMAVMHAQFKTLCLALGLGGDADGPA